MARIPIVTLKTLRVGRGDNLYVVETKNGIQLTAYDPAFAQQVETAERVMRKDRDALKKLAEQVPMAKIVWLLEETVIAIHHRQISEHGGEVLRDAQLADWIRKRMA